jgi:voltage-gated potassium channel
VLRLLRIFSLRNLLSLEGIQFAAFVAAFTVVVGGAVYASVEDTSDKPLTTWDGIWWAVTTVTTVGYGGFPETDTGRAIAIAVMFVGIGFVALLTAFVADRFIKRDVEPEVMGREDELMAKLSEISDRLERVEAAVRRQ